MCLIVRIGSKLKRKLASWGTKWIGRVRVRNEECLFALQRWGGKKQPPHLFISLELTHHIEPDLNTFLRVDLRAILNKWVSKLWVWAEIVCDSETRMSCLHVKKCKSNELSHRSYNMIINKTHTEIGTRHLPLIRRYSLAFENATKMKATKLINGLELRFRAFRVVCQKTNRNCCIINLRTQ